MNRLITIILVALVMPIALLAQVNWTEHTIEGNFDGAMSVYAIDLDSDGDVDVLGAAKDANDIAWWENDGSCPPTFTKHIIDASFDGANSVYAIDLDGDSAEDVLGAGYTADEIAWWKNDGLGNFGIKQTIDSTFDGAFSVYGFDLDGDSAMDVLGTAHNAGEIAWWKSDGGNPPIFTKHIIDSLFNSARTVCAIDLDGDNVADVLGTGAGPNEIAWWKNNGSGNFGTRQIIGTLNGACSAYGIDLDGDDDADVLGAGYNAQEIAWWENDGVGNFGTKQTIDSTFRGSTVYAIDINADSAMDVLGSNFSANEIAWWENDGVGNFGTKQTIDSMFDGARHIYAIDIEPDGDVDVLGAASGADEIAWWASNIADMHDVGTISIDIPSILPYDTIVYPQATVKNFGTFTEKIFVKCEIDPGNYTSNYTIVNFDPGDDSMVTFPDSFHFASGPYTVTVYSTCPFSDDENPANDTLEKVIQTTGVEKGGSVTSASFKFGLKSNLFRDNAVFNLTLPKDALITLAIFDVSGRLVDIPLKGRKLSGNHTIIWTPQANGIYFYALKSPWGSRTGKILFIQ